MDRPTRATCMRASSLVAYQPGARLGTSNVCAFANRNKTKFRALIEIMPLNVLRTSLHCRLWSWHNRLDLPVLEPFVWKQNKDGTSKQVFV